MRMLSLEMFVQNHWREGDYVFIQILRPVSPGTGYLDGLVLLVWFPLKKSHLGQFEGSCPRGHVEQNAHCSDGRKTSTLQA